MVTGPTKEKPRFLRSRLIAWIGHWRSGGSLSHALCKRGSFPLYTPKDSGQNCHIPWQRQDSPGIFDDGTNLAFRMDDTVRGHDTGHVAFPKSGNGQRVKPPKCLFQGLPFFEDKIPTQSALQGLKASRIQKARSIMERNRPFLIMIGFINGLIVHQA